LELSVIIPWRDRPEIATTLRENSAAFSARDLEVVVVNCGGDAAQLRAAAGGARLDRLRFIELEGAGFNKSLALNLGVYAARAPRLFFLDADVTLKGNFLAEALGLLDSECFVTGERVFESAAAAGDEESQLEEVAQLVRLVAAGGREACVETNRARLRDGSRSAPGLVMLSRQHFVEVDGMNSDLHGWGWEDLDLLVRLQLALGLRQRQAGAAVHLTHGDEVRYFGGRTRAESEQTNFSACLENYRLGHFYGTYADDVATWKERVASYEAGERL
jgi:glycosyltransferase involved in cell wall biosynthesis